MRYERLRLWLLMCPRRTAVAAGVMLTLGFAPFHIWPVALAGVAIFLWLFNHVSSVRAALGYGVLFSFAHHLSALYWMPQALALDSGHWWMALVGGVPALLAVTAYLTLLTLVPLLLVRRWAWLLPVGWLIGELLKNHPEFGFPWLPLGVLWSESVWLRQPAAWVGVYGLSFCAAVVAVLWSQQRWRWGMATLVVLALAGGLRLHSYTPALQENDALTASLIQPNLPPAHGWDAATRQKYVAQLVEMTTAASGTLVVWPETAIAYDLTSNRYLRAVMAAPLAQEQVIISGFPRYDFAAGEVSNYYNSMAVLAPSAEVLDVYDKQLLVPFGERIPLKNKLPLNIRTLAFNRADYTPGSGQPQLGLGDGNWALPLVCYEAIFSKHVVQHSANKRLLLNVTNDAWFNGTTAPHQHAALARLRAVENGKPLVRVGNTGVSMVTNAFGRTVKKLPAEEQVQATVIVPPALQQPTLYQRWLNEF